MTKLNLYTAVMCLFFIIVGIRAQAQCNNITVTLARTTSTCQSNGTFTVTISGPDAKNLRMTDIQFSVDGAQTRSWSHYPGNIIDELSAGSYTIKVRAFCLSNNKWEVISNAQATGTIILDYTTPDVRVEASSVRRTLNCKNTGVIPIQIANGRAPYTVKVTSAPGDYTGAPIFTLPSAQTLTLSNLPAGSYSFEIKDACSYVYNVPITINTMPQDYILNLFTDIRPLSTPISKDCNTISLYRPAIGNVEQNHYFRAYSLDYFEVAVIVGGTGAKIWVPLENGPISRYTLSKTIKEIRDGNLPIVPYLRVKGTSDPACEFELNPITLRSTIFSLTYADITCSSFTAIITPPPGVLGVTCFPYKYRILTTDGLVVVKNWSGWIDDQTSQTIPNVPYGTKIEFENHEGDKWNQSLRSQVVISTRTSQDYDIPCESHGITNNIFHGYLQLFVQNAPIPAGTTVKYIDGPMLPLNTSITTTESQDFGIFYFAQLATGSTAARFTYNLRGTYKFEITIPGCPTEEKIINYSPYTIKIPFAYTQEEACDGLKIIPSGKLGLMDYATGIVSDVSTYYSIEKCPVGVDVDKSSKDTLLLPATGRYSIKITLRPITNYLCPAKAIGIDYVKSPLSLKTAVTSAYICQGEVKGNIRVEGANGSGNYSYELYDQGVLKLTNNTGYFAYGEANKVYFVKIIDIECNTSFEQKVTMLDLSNAQIVYSGHTLNELCEGDTIKLNCITLGQTLYEWTGPGITAATKNQQNPRIPNATAAMSGTYTVTVKPEKCGAPMVQGVNITINVAPPLPATQIYDPTICDGNIFNITYSPTILDYMYNVYDDAIGGNIKGTGGGTGGDLTINCGIVAPIGAKSYYLEAVSDKGCISTLRKRVDFTVDAIPTLPTTATAAAVCEGSAVTVQVTTALAGHTYKVYDAAIAGTLKGSAPGNGGTISILCAAATGVGSITYYLEVDNGDCISATRKPVIFTVNASPTLPAITANAICFGETAIIKINASVVGYIYKVYETITGGASIAQGMGDGSTLDINCGTISGASKTYYVEVINNLGCISSSRQAVTVSVYANLTAGTISAGQTVCLGSAPLQLTSTAVGGGSGAYSYQWEQSIDGGVWTNAAGISINANYSPLPLITTTEYRRKVNDGVCGTSALSNSVTMIVRAEMFYPDIRIQACPDMDNINLSKYLDTSDVKAVVWSIIAAPATGFNANGIVNSNQFVFPDTYIYQYKITNSCEDKGGKLFLKTLKNRVYYLPPDTVVMCYKNAAEIQMNQIMGVEAGGVFEAEEAFVNTNYIDIAAAPAIYAGASIFNGERAYIELPANATYNYSGTLTSDPQAKKVVFKYTPDLGSCLNGNTYKFVIILTNQLVP